MDLATLFEMDWYDKSPLTQVLQRNRGRFVHFSNGAPNRDYRTAKLLPEPEKPAYYDRRLNLKYQRELMRVRRQNAIQAVPKMGINPRSMWQDPKGVYFYPIDWLLSGPDRVRSANQHGLGYQFYYIVDLDLSDPNGINLDTVTWETIAAIAKRNGWFEQMQSFLQMTPEDQQKELGMSYARPDHPGSFFWHFIDHMVKAGTMTWAKAYRGVSYVRDPNLSIIHNNEPDQVLVLKPGLIKVIEFGENKRPIKAGGGQDSLEQWWHALLTIIKMVRGEYGGDLAWKNKRPTLTFTKGIGKFLLTVPERSSVYGEVGLSLNYTYGRAEDSMFIPYRELDTASPTQIMTLIQQRVERIAARKTDLLFKPIMSIAEGKQVMLTQMSDLPLAIKTRIYNGNGVNDLKYSSVSLHGEGQHEVDRVAIKVACYLNLKMAEISGSCNLHVGRHHMLAVQGNHMEDYSDTDSLFAYMATKARENLEIMMRSFGPKTEYSPHDRNPRFRTPEELTACIGWMIQNSGLKLGGALPKEFAPEIAAFEAYPDRRVLLSDIAYIMNSRW